MGTMAAEPFKVGLGAAGKTAVPFFTRSSPGCTGCWHDAGTLDGADWHRLALNDV